MLRHPHTGAKAEEVHVFEWKIPLPEHLSPAQSKRYFRTRHQAEAASTEFGEHCEALGIFCWQQFTTLYSKPLE